MHYPFEQAREEGESPFGYPQTDRSRLKPPWQRRAGTRRARRFELGAASGCALSQTRFRSMRGAEVLIRTSTQRIVASALGSRHGCRTQSLANRDLET